MVALLHRLEIADKMGEVEGVVLRDMNIKETASFCRSSGDQLDVIRTVDDNGQDAEELREAAKRGLAVKDSSCFSIEGDLKRLSDVLFHKMRLEREKGSFSADEMKEMGSTKGSARA